MIELKNVSKSYLNQTAIRNMSIQFPKGKVIGLIGENGSGKSTTLKMISGLISPSKGEVKINDKDIDRRTSSELVSYLSELDVYYSFYTVMETIDFHASQYKDFDTGKAIEIMEFMKLDSNKKVKNLSKGNRGRLKILLSLSRNVPYILMDEPLAGLDPMVRDSIIKGLISFVDLDRQTIIITTHEISEIEPLLDQVILIKEGEVIGIGDVEEIRQNEQLSLIDWMKAKYEN